MKATIAAMQSKAVAGAKSVIRRFTLRQALRGSIIFGMFAAVESIAQAFGIVAAYPNAAERAKVVYSLANNAALGIFYGDRHANIATPSGYMEYRTLAFIALIGSIWGLMFITRMLRGQEENGRWELLLTGEVSAEKATARTIFGALTGLMLSYSIVTVTLLLLGRSPKIALSGAGCVLYGLAIVLPVAMGIGWGALTSQLAATRRRAILYGIAPLVLLFGVRSLGNVIDSLVWLKNLTPFGWVDKVHPFYHAQAMWLLPVAALAVVFCIIAILLAGKRDMMASIVADADSAQPKFGLLNSQLGFTVRSTRNVLFGWLIASLGFGSLIAAIDKTAANAVGNSSFTKTFSNLSGNPSAQFELAYLAAAGYLTVTILMVMVTSSLAAARDEEASGRLDNFLSRTVSRRGWLVSRLAVLVAGATLITLITDFVVWAIASAQDIQVSLGTLLFGGLNILGPVIFLLGLGVLIFGYRPRFATAAMYLLIAWSFTLDIVASALKISHYVADTSLLHHISLVPAASAKWGTFLVLTGSGLLLIIWGLKAFENRDLVAE